MQMREFTLTKVKMGDLDNSNPNVRRFAIILEGTQKRFIRVPAGMEYPDIAFGTDISIRLIEQKVDTSTHGTITVYWLKEITKESV